jgi:hypothetical protein
MGMLLFIANRWKIYTMAVLTKSKKFKIQVEKFSDIMVELPELFSEQYSELVVDKDGLTDDADYQRYVGLEKLQVLHCITARHNGKLIGYFFNMVVYHLQHRGMKTSMSDLIYILPEYRKGTGVGLSLLRAGVTEMRKLGVKKMYVTAKINTALGVVLNKLKFRMIEVVFSRWIGEAA